MLLSSSMAIKLRQNFHRSTSGMEVLSPQAKRPLSGTANLTRSDERVMSVRSANAWLDKYTSSCIRYSYSVTGTPPSAFSRTDMRISARRWSWEAIEFRHS